MRDELCSTPWPSPGRPGAADRRGRGRPAFCSGGDLDEFGTLADPASAHLVRIGRSVGSALHLVADGSRWRSTARRSGRGSSFAAFAGRVDRGP